MIYSSRFFLIFTLVTIVNIVVVGIPHSKAEESIATNSYEPMAIFEQFSGKVMRGEWEGENGETVVDISYGEMILDGRAYQGTHKIEGSSYGGRTIIFYDEGANEYVYHYFTTGGFHTTGKIETTETGYSGTEKVNGHPTIAAVASTLTVDGDKQIVAVKYQTHEGIWSEEPVRTYKPYDGNKPFQE